MIRIMTTHFALAAVAVIIIWQLLQRFHKHVHLPYPPGPKGLPFLGNINIPSDHQWLKLAELTKEYGRSHLIDPFNLMLRWRPGDIFSLTMLGQKIIVLGSAEATTDLFEKRSTIYASRPEAYMFRYLMGFDWSMVLMPYSDLWRHQRKIFENFFRQQEIPKFHQSLTREVHMTLYRLLQTPELFLEHCRLLFGATILDIVYGLGHKGPQDPIFVNGERVMQTLGEVTVPGNFWVDNMPLINLDTVRYIPAWMPGAEFQRKARLWRSWGEDFLNIPWNRVKKNIQHGGVQPSFASKMIEEMDNNDTGAWEEDIYKPVAAVGYAGGADTTVATLQSVFLAMCLYPDVQNEPMQSWTVLLLPYIDALMKAIPHLTLKDDVYRGYFIPKGSLVIGNSWEILHDPQLYGPNTEEFSPERFLLENGQLNPNMPDTGRCPGRHLSDATLFIAVACILHTFNITPPLDANGVEIKLEARQSPTILAPPEKFACVIKPRSEAAADLVENLCLQLKD
ncbi:cytochrome P450 [Mycena floridula]|nr:cytochrome P450 [Mycena floridula]